MSSTDYSAKLPLVSLPKLNAQYARVKNTLDPSIQAQFEACTKNVLTTDSLDACPVLLQQSTLAITNNPDNPDVQPFIDSFAGWLINKGGNRYFSGQEGRDSLIQGLKGWVVELSQL